MSDDEEVGYEPQPDERRKELLEEYKEMGQEIRYRETFIVTAFFLSFTGVGLTYNGRHHEGVIQDGMWLVEGKRFSSPSGAARGVAITKQGKHPHLDGWSYWEARSPGSSLWVSLAQLRFDAGQK